jgi:tetraacyldisaccharide 4'-kinase
MKALLPLSWLYGAAIATRNRYYDAVEPKKLPVPVVSVGNLTVGGSGKTPLVAAIARMLLAREVPVAVVSRGYGREGNAPFVLVSDGKQLLVSAREGGDEPVELAARIPGLVVAVGADRFVTGKTLLDELGEHVIVLDDGFQHRRLARDLDLVCFDCSEPASSLALLPAGRLREPIANLGRADGVVLTRWSESCVAPDIGALGGVSDVAVIRAVSRLEGFTRLDVPAQRLDADAFRGERLGVAVGIARPERVRESLGSARDIVHFVARRDHHRWRESELREIAEAAKAKGATSLLTTGKDSVKMLLPSSMPLPVYRIDVETEILDLETFETLLAFPPL